MNSVANTDIECRAVVALIRLEVIPPLTVDCATIKEEALGAMWIDIRSRIPHSSTPWDSDQPIKRA